MLEETRVYAATKVPMDKRIPGVKEDSCRNSQPGLVKGHEGGTIDTTIDQQIEMRIQRLVNMAFKAPRDR